ncbi:MAG TPA: DUF2804 domain-containing protein [Planococcus sp. (in: firmicutes)]|nr:DUF2804 domain-containing protein [Planococcus sp. (in: firmicutes)]
MQHLERELNDSVFLCDAKGQLNPSAIGYAKQPLVECNLRRNFMRKKKWNNWCVFGEELMVSASIGHLDYATVCNVFVLNYDTQRFHEKTVVLPFIRQVKLATKPMDTSYFKNEDLVVEFSPSDQVTNLAVTTDDFDGESLVVNLIVEHPEDHDSLNVVIPWNRQTFQFAGKHLSLPASGTVMLGSKRFEFDEDYSFAVLDYGRGVLPRESLRNWAVASQNSYGKVLGLNFGGKWTDGTGMTENAFFVNGDMTKIHEDILFHYNKDNYKEPWLVHTKFSDDVKLTFTPFFERVSAIDLKLAKSEVHQLVGYYNGYVRYGNGVKLKISQVLGSIEEHYAKW